MNKPVTIITGFLGAGKTAFLNAVIAYKKPARLAIIENEFGEQGIDAELIVNGTDSVFEMSNGCLCCTLGDDLFDVLNQLASRADDWDELVIETTGIADPASVALPFLITPALKRDFPLARVVCLIDPLMIEQRLSQTEEAMKQISFSDILLITKTDTTTPEQVLELRQKLQSMNPWATILQGNHEDYPLDEVFAFERAEQVGFRLDHTAAQPQAPLLKQGTAFQHTNIVSLSFTFDQPFDILALQNRLNAFVVFQAVDVYRIKGIIHADGYQRRMVIQSVGNKIVILPGKPWADDEIRQSKVVFIGKNLQEEGYAKLLKAALVR
jgi:G3E family GTPase